MSGFLTAEDLALSTDQLVALLFFRNESILQLEMLTAIFSRVN